jgi:hypothetical protein
MKRNRGIDMKGFLSQKQVETIKEQYPAGTRIELFHMDDPYGPIDLGRQGTVDSVDDAGTLHMRWDNGRTIGIVPGEDQFKVIPKSQEEVMDNDQKQTIELKQVGKLNSKGHWCAEFIPYIFYVLNPYKAG